MISRRIAKYTSLFMLRLARLSPAQLYKIYTIGWIARMNGLRFKVNSADGTRIAAVFLPATPGIPVTPGINRTHENTNKNSGGNSGGNSGDNSGGGRLPVVLIHGWGVVKESMLKRARVFLSRGHDCIIIDLRCHGNSGGSHVTFGKREREDVAVVIDALQRQNLIGKKVLLYGLSLGAATCLQLVGDDKRIAGVVALAPFRDMASAVESYRRRYAPFINANWLIRGFEDACRSVGFEMSEASTIESAKKITVPVLLLVGSTDRNLGRENHTQHVYDAIRPGLCKMIEVFGASGARGPHHFNLHRVNRWPGMDEEIMRFYAGIT